MSPLLRCRASAVRGLIIAALSQVSDVSGFGSSCSHPLFAKRPSQIVVSGRKMVSMPVAAGGAAAAAAKPGCRGTVLGGACVLGMKPLISAGYQNPSKAAGVGAAAGGPSGAQLQGVGRRDVPRRERGRLSAMQAVVDAEGRFLQWLAKVQVGGRRVDRVAAQDDGRLRPAGVHLVRQVGQRALPVAEVSLDR